jgi:hypothetical protein
MMYMGTQKRIPFPQDLQWQWPGLLATIKMGSLVPSTSNPDAHTGSVLQGYDGPKPTRDLHPVPARPNCTSRQRGCLRGVGNVESPDRHVV